MQQIVEEDESSGSCSGSVFDEDECELEDDGGGSLEFEIEIQGELGSATQPETRGNAVGILERIFAVATSGGGGKENENMMFDLDEDAASTHGDLKFLHCSDVCGNRVSCVSAYWLSDCKHVHGS